MAAGAAGFAALAAGGAGITGFAAGPVDVAGGATLCRCAPKVRPPPSRFASASPTARIIVSAANASARIGNRFIVRPPAPSRRSSRAGACQCTYPRCSATTPGGKVVNLDAIESGDAHHRLQRGLVGMHPDRLGQITVARVVAGDELANARNHVETVPVVGGCEGRPHARELEHRRDAARPQHATHLGQRDLLARHVAQPERDAHAVERRRSERQLLGVALYGG